MSRRISRKIMVGNVPVGGDAPVTVQSMLNVPAADIPAAEAQIAELANAGAEILRLSIDNKTDADALRQLVSFSTVPLIADIQFDWHAAILALEAGAAAVRVNPGLLPAESEGLKMVAAAVVEHDAAIRVGANAGSLGEAAITGKMAKGLSRNDATAQLLAERALAECEKLEKLGVRNIKAALKCSNTAVTVAANRFFAERSDLPLHIGITEAGSPRKGIIKSAAGIGALLLAGVGDTIRVSLTAPPVEEIHAGIAILEACGMRCAMPEIVSCPTCGRTEIDLVGLTTKVEMLVDDLKLSGKKLSCRKIAVMGCPVNGPGEARDADLGLAGTRSGKVVLFRHGVTIGAYSEAEGVALLEKLLTE